MCLCKIYEINKCIKIKLGPIRNESEKLAPNRSIRSSSSFFYIIFEQIRSFLASLLLSFLIGQASKRIIKMINMENTKINHNAIHEQTLSKIFVLIIDVIDELLISFDNENV
jgi:hypothetical protein